MSYYCYMNEGYTRPYQGLPQKAKVQQQQDRYTRPVSDFVDLYEIKKNDSNNGLSITVKVENSETSRRLDSGWVLPIFAARGMKVMVTISRGGFGDTYSCRFALDRDYRFYKVSEILEECPLRRTRY